MGRRSANSPLPSPTPLTVVTPPHSPLRRIVKRANELVESRSNPSTVQTASSSNGSIIDKDSKSLPMSPLKTMLSSSNSRTMLVST